MHYPAARFQPSDLLIFIRDLHRKNENQIIPFIGLRAEQKSLDWPG